MNAAPHNSSNSNVFMLGALINSLALSGMSGLIDYTVKAILGGCIWLGFKIISDYISERIHQKKNIGKQESENLKKTINP